MVKRYDQHDRHEPIEEMANGDYVRHEDYAALAERCERLETQLAEASRKAMLWDDLQDVRNKAASEPDDAAWKMLAKDGRLIEAVKACRSSLGCSITEAKDAVMAFTRATP